MIMGRYWFYFCDCCLEREVRRGVIEKVSIMALVLDNGDSGSLLEGIFLRF